MPPEIGRKAPLFTLTADDGSVVSLRELRGSKVVLYFYPKDDTKGCTVEACEFRDQWAELTRMGVVVLGVSPDGIKSHEQFRSKFELPFRLLSDPDHAVALRYGVWGEKSLYGRKYLGVIRTTFLIDEAGVIRQVFERVKPRGHSRQVLQAISLLDGE